MRGFLVRGPTVQLSASVREQVRPSIHLDRPCGPSHSVHPVVLRLRVRRCRVLWSCLDPTAHPSGALGGLHDRQAFCPPAPVRVVARDSRAALHRAARVFSVRSCVVRDALNGTAASLPQIRVQHVMHRGAMGPRPWGESSTPGGRRNRPSRSTLAGTRIASC